MSGVVSEVMSWDETGTALIIPTPISAMLSDKYFAKRIAKTDAHY